MLLVCSITAFNPATKSGSRVRYGATAVIWWPPPAARFQRMQKALIEMNMQLSNVLSDLSGVSGMAIINAILNGERDTQKLAALAEPEVKASARTIALSLEGNWREELLFVLGQEVQLYRTYQEHIADCDLQLHRHLKSFDSRVDLSAQPIGPRPKGT